MYRSLPDRLKRRRYNAYVRFDENVGRWRAGRMSSRQTGSFISETAVKRIKGQVAHANRVRAIQRRHLKKTGELTKHGRYKVGSGEYLRYKDAQKKLRQLNRKKQGIGKDEDVDPFDVYFDY